jgi:uncharacterized protein with PIN domain
MGYDELIQKIGKRSVIVDACLPLQLVKGLQKHGIDAIWVPYSLGASAKDDYIESQLNGRVLLTRDFAFAKKLGDKGILLKGYFNKRRSLALKMKKDSEWTTEFKLKRGMRIVFGRKIKHQHSHWEVS